MSLISSSGNRHDGAFMKGDRLAPMSRDLAYPNLAKVVSFAAYPTTYTPGVVKILSQYHT
ncbi:unnamed protein product [Clonostachys rosea f. rosea IK726]|uniref:Uncharacterized protein n=1 Tax=Clonostachys rosea f. rosea IK726 TaxID=1349383 RepID=A0ACA9TLH8_BIOOC|nr:unnamed protein product [Clonostachys rosea f. rosea IK726]